MPRLAQYLSNMQRRTSRKKNFTGTLAIAGSREYALNTFLISIDLLKHRFDEDEKLAGRYRKFDIAALSEAAVRAVGCGAKSCKTWSGVSRSQTPNS